MTRGDATYLYGSPAPRRWDDLIWPIATMDALSRDPAPKPIRLSRYKTPKHNPPNAKRAKVKAARKQRRKGSQP